MSGICCNKRFTWYGKRALMHGMTQTDHTQYHSTHFGFQPVDETRKEPMVQNVFSRVASSYDLMNDAMSAGIHHHWKDRLIDTLRPNASMRLLDVAGGTGDVAFRFLKAGGGYVTVSDLNEDMLRVGQSRAIDRNLDIECMDWLPANAQSLPCQDASYDAYTISFGIRNVTHLDQALSEAHRVLRRGGRFLCLEFAVPSNEWIRQAYHAYSFNVIPKLGKMLANDEASYQYLVESIEQFPDPDLFATLIEDAGFDRVTYRTMTSGVVAIHSGWKL